MCVFIIETVRGGLGEHPFRRDFLSKNVSTACPRVDTPSGLMDTDMHMMLSRRCVEIRHHRR